MARSVPPRPSAGSEKQLGSGKVGRWPVESGWLLTLLCWGTLVVAGMLFAAVVLAPKFATQHQLQTRFAENQLRLVELERQAAELERLVHALENDPHFAAELAKLDFAPADSGEEQIAVSAELRWQAPATIFSTARLPTRPGQAENDFNTRLIALLAHNHSVRRAMLLLAAFLVAVAFLVLNERCAVLLTCGSGAALHGMHRIMSRYQPGMRNQTGRRNQSGTRN